MLSRSFSIWICITLISFVLRLLFHNSRRFCISSLISWIEVLTAFLLKIRVFCDVIPCRLISLTPKIRSYLFFRNVDNYHWASCKNLADLNLLSHIACGKFEFQRHLFQKQSDWNWKPKKFAIPFRAMHEVSHLELKHRLHRLFGSGTPLMSLSIYLQLIA